MGEKRPRVEVDERFQRQRVEVDERFPEAELETELTVDPEVKRVFEATMASRDPPVERGSETWKAVFDELVMERLREKSLSSWKRQMKIRGVRLPGEDEDEDSKMLPMELVLGRSPVEMLRAKAQKAEEFVARRLLMCPPKRSGVNTTSPTILIGRGVSVVWPDELWPGSMRRVPMTATP